MCGIAGIFRFDSKEVDKALLQKSIKCLENRGPNFQAIYSYKNVGLAHSRLAIIDLDASSNQPFHDKSGRYTLIFNGEIFNYKHLRKELISRGIHFNTNSDTEVLLQLLIHENVECLNKLNGFFAFAFYDSSLGELILARDKYGVKPLYYFHTNDCFYFGSELKSLLSWNISKNLDYSSLLLYFQLNYIPSPYTILKDVHKLPSSHWIKITNDHKITNGKYYDVTFKESTLSYVEKKTELEKLLEDSVTDRLTSDVPLGVFLSGGVDSSVVSLLAKRHIADLQTFSIGFKDSKFFDESIYAEKVAKFIGTHHHTFFLSNKEMIEGLANMLFYIDEPFADSSAIALYVLCKNAKKHVTVALTGDGADEVFGGYNKHLAEAKIRRHNLLNRTIKFSSPLLSVIPESRSNTFGNFVRKARKYSSSINLSYRERYWEWCSFTKETDALQLFYKGLITQDHFLEYHKRKDEKTKYLHQGSSLQQMLLSDIQLVLEGDMLVKTDRMSMAHGMELRNPFLDSRVVDFSFTLNDNDKIGSKSKRILKDTFENYLPTEVFNRPKHGFEVPLLKWFREDLKDLVEESFDAKFLKEQHLFNPAYLIQLKNKLYSSYPEDVPQRIWSLIVFQKWWKNYFA